MRVVEPGLPHGRLWVAERGCECDACAQRLREVGAEDEAAVRAAEAERERQARIAAGARPVARPATKALTFKLTPREWVVVGPVDQVSRGTHIARNITTGKTHEVFIHRVGRPFRQDGVWQRYGYIRR